MVQKIGCTTHSIRYIKIVIVFVESKYVLPKEILENSDFADLNSVVAINGEEEAYAIILHLYKSNTQICQEEQLSPYHKVDPIILWFVNTIIL